MTKSETRKDENATLKTHSAFNAGSLSRGVRRGGEKTAGGGRDRGGNRRGGERREGKRGGEGRSAVT